MSRSGHRWISLAGVGVVFSLGVVIGRGGSLPPLARGAWAASAPAAAPTRAAAPAADQPSWVLPVTKARQQAREEGRPLLIVSLNGNLDGYC
jgi:hypothetical protein